MAAVVLGALLLERGDRERWPASARPELPLVSNGYWVLTCALVVAWTFEYIPTYWQVLFFGGLAALLILSGARWPSRARSYVGVLFAGLSFWVSLGFFRVTGWPDLLGLLLAPASLRLARRLNPEAPVSPRWTSNVTAVATFCIWLWVTRLTHQTGHRDLLTLAWSGLAVAVFVAGLTLRDRIYRIGGFAILALAIGRIFLVDVWRLETIYRILSFLGLGIVLLALGFVYNRYAEKIRKWL